MKKLFAIALILVGLGLLLYTPLQELYSKYVENKLIKMYEDTYLEISEPEKQDISSFYKYYEDLQLEAKNENNKDEINKNIEDSFENTDIIGIITIEKINLKLPIKNNFIETEIKSSVGHLDSTAYPGEFGNCVIAGHRCYTKGKLFNRLDELAIGDFIYINYNSKEYKYKVVNIQVVEPTDNSVLNAENNEIALTLITCHPYKVNTHRLIIKAVIDK